MLQCRLFTVNFAPFTSSSLSALRTAASLCFFAPSTSACNRSIYFLDSFSHFARSSSRLWRSSQSSASHALFSSSPHSRSSISSSSWYCLSSRRACRNVSMYFHFSYYRYRHAAYLYLQILLHAESDQYFNIIMWHVVLHFNIQVGQLCLEDTGQGSITLKTYFKYFLLGSGYVLFTVMCALFLVSQVSTGQCSYELSYDNKLYS